MLRNGQFDNLRWDKLADAHSANWDLLRTRYRLRLEQSKPVTPLDELAVEAVHACREYLFTDSREQDPSFGWRTGTAAGLLPANMLEKRLTPALCDHLIVTFAHQLLCDNLVHLEQTECLERIFQCRIESAPSGRFGLNHYGRRVEDKDPKQKSNFIQSKGTTCNAYGEKVARLLAFRKRLTEADCWDPATDDSGEHELVFVQESGRKIFLVRAHPKEYTSEEVKAELDRIDQEESARIANRFAPPNWAFSTASACNQKPSPLAVPSVPKDKDTPIFIRDYEKGESQAFRLAQFLGDSEWGPLLFQEVDLEQTPKDKKPEQIVHLSFTPAAEIADRLKEDRSRIPPTVELWHDADDNEFVGVPYIKDSTFRCPLPPQEYSIWGSPRSYKIVPEIQRMLNCYLVERTFHGYAAASALTYIRMRQNQYDFQLRCSQYLMLPLVVRLHAPLVHPAMMWHLCNVIDDASPGEDALSWMDGCIDYWNRLALPVVEETFLQMVWASYGRDSVDAILSAVTEALMRDEGQRRRCDRLNRYRLLTTETFPKEATKGLGRDILSCLTYANTYLAGLSMVLQPDGAITADSLQADDLGHAMAFDPI